MYRRAVAVILQDNSVLMVRHEHDGRVYWTLPGGGLEPDETMVGAAIRELYEETGVQARAGRLLYQTDRESCFLLEPETVPEPRLGYDPELGPHEQMITAVRWIPLHELTEDIQVSRVIAALSAATKEKLISIKDVDSN